MAIAHSTKSLFGFLATTALGVGLTFVNKKVGIVVATVGATCSVLNLLYNLCFRKNAPTEPLGKGWQKVDKDGNVSLLLSDDEDELTQREGANDPFSNLPLVLDNNTTAVQHNPGVIERMLKAVFGNREEHAKQL